MPDQHKGPKSAVVLAAGLGKRMRPLTDHIPKPMVQVAGVTLIDRVLTKIADAGVGQIIVNSHYRAEVLEKHLQEHLLLHPFPNIIISREDILLETGGGVAKVLPYLTEGPFFVINSDILWIDGIEPALSKLIAAWDDSKMDALLLVHNVKKAVGYDEKGDFFLRPSGELVRGQEAEHPFVFTGIQILSPRLFHEAPDGAFSLNVLYGRGRKHDGSLPRIFGVEHEGDWLHIGTPEGVQLAENFLEQNASNR